MDRGLLQTFIAVHETGTITAACEVLHLSQPAVSRRVAQLERELEAPLFERTSRGMILSAAGLALLPYANAALASLNDGYEAVRSLRDEDTGPVSVAVVGTLATRWLTLALRRFAARHPRVDLWLRTANSEEVGELVQRGNATIGISYLRWSHAELALEHLFDEPLAVVCAPEHPLAGQTIRSLSALRDERWLAFPDPWPRLETSSRYIHGLLAAAGVAEQSIQFVDSLTAQKRLVEAGFGFAVLPGSAVEEERAAGAIGVVNVRQRGLSSMVTLATRRRGYLSRAARSLMVDLKDAAGGRAPPTEGRRRPTGARHLES